MDKWVDDLYGICENVTDELSEAKKKLDKSGGKMTAGDLDYIDKLTHTLKSIKTTLAMEEAGEDGEYSGNYSGARGRGRNARRDSMGRYSNDGRMPYYGGTSYEGRMDGRSGRRGYSREDAKEDMMDQLRDLEMSAQDEKTRRMVKEWIRQAERE